MTEIAAAAEPPAEIEIKTAETAEFSIRERIQALDLRGRAKTIVALGALTAAAYSAERFGVTDLFPTGVKEVGNSLAHPIFGYLGGLATAAVVQKPWQKLAAGIAATTAFDYAVEKIQSMVDSSPQSANFLSRHNLPETAKDFAFALGGLLFFWHESQKNKKEQIKENSLPEAV